VREFACFRPVAIVTRLIFFCSALPAQIARPVSHRSSQFSRPAFFYRSFFWALLQANSCVLQLRVFCFPGSSRTTQVPPIKQPLALEAEASCFGCPRKMGQKKEIFSCPTELSNDHRLRRRRPGAASSAERQQLEVHRSVRRDAAVVEEHRRRMGVEDRVASRLRYMESAEELIKSTRQTRMLDVKNLARFTP